MAGDTKKLVAACTKQLITIDPKEDMRAERAKATFDAHQLACLLHGGQDKLDAIQRLSNKLQTLDWGRKDGRYFLTREEEYVGGLRAAFGIWELMKQEGLSLQDGLTLRKELFWPGGLELHIGMFIPTLQSQGTPEQQAYWLDLALNLKIIGTYAQTELGHGTYVRGLETVAVYDPQHQQFVIHSPTLTSTKWWPGGLGKTATHVVLMARLFTHGRDYGPHAFVVQIRDIQTHLPLPGVTVGDIGAKMGYNGVDNGFLSFDHVTIPRENMLMRYAKVQPDGTYVPPPAANAKASYATMVYVRATIVEDAGSILARAATIAVRYNAVRRQMSPAGPGRPELQVIDYQNSAYILFPLVSSAYALFFMGQSMMKMYKQFEKDRDAGNFATLPELHALSSGLKAVCTWITADGIEQCRRCCGGHGYSLLSGLPTLFASYVQNVTWEGDNNVMALQTARYLVKAVLNSRSGKGAGGQQGSSAAYLAQPCTQERCGVTGVGGWQELDAQLAALRYRAHRLCESATTTLAAASPNNTVAFEGPPWNGNTVPLIQAAKAHCLYALHDNFVQVVRGMRSTVGGGVPGALEVLARLHGLCLLEQGAADLLEVGYMTGEQLRMLRVALREVLVQVRPNAVAYVDAFGFTDYMLNSALGRKDGDVYRALYDMAQGSPLNATPEGPAWEPVLKKYLASRSKL